MAVDQFGSSLESTLRDLIKRIEKLEASQRAGPGLQIGQASGAFLIPATATPSTPGSGAYLYVSGSQPRWRSIAGDFPISTPAADNVGNIVNGPADATYSDTERSMLNEIKLTVNQLLDGMRATIPPLMQ